MDLTPEESILGERNNIKRLYEKFIEQEQSMPSEKRITLDKISRINDVNELIALQVIRARGAMHGFINRSESRSLEITIKDTFENPDTVPLGERAGLFFIIGKLAKRCEMIPTEE